MIILLPAALLLALRLTAGFSLNSSTYQGVLDSQEKEQQAEADKAEYKEKQKEMLKEVERQEAQLSVFNKFADNIEQNLGPRRSGVDKLVHAEHEDNEVQRGETAGEALVSHGSEKEKLRFTEFHAPTLFDVFQLYDRILAARTLLSKPPFRIAPDGANALKQRAQELAAEKAKLLNSIRNINSAAELDQKLADTRQRLEKLEQQMQQLREYEQLIPAAELAKTRKQLARENHALSNKLRLLEEVEREGFEENKKQLDELQDAEEH